MYSLVGVGVSVWHIYTTGDIVCVCTCARVCAPVWGTFQTLNQCVGVGGLLLIRVEICLPKIFFTKKSSVVVAEKMWGLERSQLLCIKTLAFISKHFHTV